ncbi:hypothetical protein KZ483_24190 [Paenibacillus sp. sptzw28]|uniref:hypothetical protein n=1 Tax=Paenibacillus sp. sptzw28 TaxID=715179 RepID=UPI001C6E548F|nr:hypothetical protein [Paenibacillus sp. sptzw28]QYR20821.1 hypothetical protein KZ483_24190 [Paenibacillus sp. sptzw28]
MNWRKANRQMLVEIAYFDEGALLEHRCAAAAELKRRNRVKHARMQNKEKAVYPR